jgi:hypothetical protein
MECLARGDICTDTLLSNMTFVEKLVVSVSVPIERSPAMQLHGADVLTGPLAVESCIKG